MKYKLNKYSRQSCVYVLLFILMSSLSTCKKKPHFTGEEFEGYWELQQLVIDGHDTTAFIKSDSNCYGDTRFFIDRETGVYYVHQIPVHNSLNFYCGQQGHWTYIGPLIIDYGVSSVNVGPYLAGERISWSIITNTDAMLSLHVIYQNMPCEMILKRKL